MKITTLLSLPVSAAILFSACTRTQTTQNFDDAEAADSSAVAKAVCDDDLNRSRTILYTLPAPVEVAQMIKGSDVRFDDQLLASLGRADSYTSNLKMALNLGIYATDMSMAGMFGQSQRMVDYLGTLNGLTRRLGIMKVLDEETLSRLERYDLTRQEALGLISEVYMNTNQYLTENNRMNIAATVMTGAWVEGLYLALNLVNPDKLTPDIVGRLVAQKLTVATMLGIIDEGIEKGGGDTDLEYLHAKVEAVGAAFEAVELRKTGRVSAITDEEARLTTIKANLSSELDADILMALKEVVSKVRAEFVS